MWLLLDEHDEANDKRLAAHIIAVHQGRVGAPAPAPAAEGAAAGGQAGSSRQQQRRQQEGASTSGVSETDMEGMQESSALPFSCK
jgi:DNA replicative helicase MCM subunit Mcm2 (Cdc46/Mcm family)